MTCGKPISSSSGEGNLHFQNRAAGAGFFYCPVKASNQFGVPQTMTFAEFKATPNWPEALQLTKAALEQKQRNKDAADARRKAAGHGKPGPRPPAPPPPQPE